ncbi:DUF4132 domain-containing protein [Hamadaea tsunoensis]|uniref:DUF4132 domain-containing protein n=1 Tax=Hamadaea tsunoensis TaxID=53368 RepID=UPI000422BEEA|nr:DUF4132 domain-containing protein [Hamadaea tsunoensis]
MAHNDFALHREQMDALGRLRAAGDWPALADAVVAYARSPRQAGRDRDWRDVSAVSLSLLKIPADRLLDVLAELMTRLDGLDDEDHRRVLGHLVLRTLGSFPAGAAPDAAERLLELAGRYNLFIERRQVADWAQIVHDAGRRFSPAALGVVRRTVEVAGYWVTDAIKPILASYAGTPLNPGEAWADRAVADAADLGPAWGALLAHAAKATSARPSAKWEAEARRLLAATGETTGDHLRSWYALVGRPRTVPLRSSEYEGEVNETFDPVNATVLRGLIWLAAYVPEHPETARVLGAVVDTSLRKVAGIGPRNPKTANAAVWALANIPTEAALAQIARLATRVTFKGTLKELNAALDARAAALGLSREEVEELAVPTYGLTAVGVREEKFGDTTVTFDAAAGMVTWRTGAGKVVKAPPAAVRTGYAEELKEFKAGVKDVEKMLSAQAERLDRQFLARRVWEFGAWRERYLDHPLIGVHTRRLIWLVDGVACAYADGSLRTVAGAAVDGGREVVLWHPIGRPVDEVLAWRAWLEDRRVTQPFKQAHREVYLLTAAEENTRTYSNRFAAHVLRQHQFHALAAVRGWRNRLRLMVDDSYEPALRELPAWGLRAEYWIEGIGDDWVTDTTESGSYLRVATDQVRFYPVAAPENYAHAGGGGYEQWVPGGAQPTDPIPLADIPPLVLSEVLRDIDLFVGVASVGNDPTWEDGGPEGRFREYWQSFSFGELSGTAETRKALLERLVPRLAIRDRAHVDGRFLVVRGDRRTYKIHLGSGNILMEPNDQYLCIVPKQAPERTGDLFLPFEGDRVLAVILSKAMLLAKDTEITDPSITRQLTLR